MTTETARGWRWLLGAGVVFLLGAGLLYAGFVMSFLVPGYPGESFFSGERALKGFLPFGLGLAVLSVAGLLFFIGLQVLKPSNRIRSSDAVAWSVGGALGLIFLFFVVASLFSQR